ncbi:ribbon-helix-helix domain-containing protein [Candidatus Poribacteria bacterium]|nr:ribbon-helix-helix domain-containing protein [Candidatus Poribacteria bacterium]
MSSMTRSPRDPPDSTRVGSGRCRHDAAQCSGFDGTTAARCRGTRTRSLEPARTAGHPCGSFRLQLGMPSPLTSAIIMVSILMILRYEEECPLAVTRKISITVSLEPDQVAQLDTISETTRVPKSVLVREAVARVLKDYQALLNPHDGARGDQTSKSRTND